MKQVVNKTMVGRTCRADGSVVNYILINEKYESETLDTKATAELVAKGMVENLELVGGEIKSSNGAINKYATFSLEESRMTNKPMAVILNRIQDNDKLIGYTVFDADGIIREYKVDKAVQLLKTTGIANGKIRETNSGAIVSSIKGEYPVRVISLKKSVEQNKPKVRISYICKMYNGSKAIEYAGVVVQGKSVSAVTDFIENTTVYNEKIIKAMPTESLTESVKPIRVSAELIFTVIPLELARKLMDTGFIDVKGSAVVLSVLKVEGTEVDEMGAVINKDGVLGDFSENATGAFKKWATELAHELRK